MLAGLLYLDLLSLVFSQLIATDLCVGDSWVTKLKAVGLFKYV